MTKQRELIFVPFPVPGHLLVTIELAKFLINLDRQIHTVTVFHWKLPYGPDSEVFARSLAAPQPRIRLAALPDVRDPPPLELFSRAPESYILKFVKKTVPLFRDALSCIVASRDGSDSVRVAGLIIDFFCIPFIDVGKELNLPSYIFLTCNAGFLGMMKYLPERHRSIPSELDRSCGDEGLHIPGFVSSVPTSVMPPGLFVRESYKAWIELAERFPDAKGILVNSFTDLERTAFDHFSREVGYTPVYAVGPVLSLKDRPNPDLDSAERDRILRWLDDQPNSSVVFLCFGSLGIHSGPQLKEIAQALELVGCRFLWSIRTNMREKTSPYDLLPDGFRPGRGSGRSV